MSETRRAVVTGIGCVSAAGTGVGELRDALRRRRSPIRPIDRFDPSPFRSRIAAQADGFDPLLYMEKRRAQRLDRFSQFAVAAASLALADAGLAPDWLEPERTGVMMGSALGGAALGEQQHREYVGGGVRAVSPMLALSVFCGAASCNIAIEFGLTGPNETNAMSCAAGAVAIGSALRAIRRGEAEVMLAGGAEAPLAPLCFGAFSIIRAMSCRNDLPERACRPFDRERDGFVMGEGASVLVVEEERHARRRGARIYAELAGYGLTNDAHHMTAPLPCGSQAARSIRLALADAGMRLDQVGYINAHASSTPLNDVTEARSIRSVWGDRTPPVSGTKALYGHPLGASGAIEAAVTCLALHDGWLPPTCNLEEADPAVELDLVTGEGREASPTAALSNSFGFGGVNACLAFRRV